MASIEAIHAFLEAAGDIQRRSLWVPARRHRPKQRERKMQVVCGATEFFSSRDFPGPIGLPNFHPKEFARP